MVAAVAAAEASSRKSPSISRRFSLDGGGGGGGGLSSQSTRTRQGAVAGGTAEVAVRMAALHWRHYSLPVAGWLRLRRTRYRLQRSHWYLPIYCCLHFVLHRFTSFAVAQYTGISWDHYQFI